MEENKNKYFSIYLKKSVLKTRPNFIKTEIEKIAVKKINNNNVVPQPFYKPITRILNIETNLS